MDDMKNNPEIGNANLSGELTEEELANASGGTGQYKPYNCDYCHRSIWNAPSYPVMHEGTEINVCWKCRVTTFFKKKQ